MVVPLRGEISGAQFFFLRRALKEAERDHASAFVIDMDTYGGSIDAAFDNMDALLQTQVPTFTYVNSKALSAGALIALATQSIYMSPAAVIGAAAPVQHGGEDLRKTMADKTASALSAMARAAAQQRGHNPDLADAFILKSKELKIGDVTVDGPDSLLTLSASEAVRQFDGKPLLAAGIALTLDEMLRAAGLAAPVRRVSPSGFEQLAVWVTAFAPLLLLGGIVGAFIEVKTPGFGLPGISSLVCFGLFFAGHLTAGLAGWEAAALFTLGLVLVLSELFLHPGTIVPGVLGAVLMAGALVWAMVDRYPGQPLWPTGDMLVRPMVNFGLAALAAAVAIYFLAKLLPRTSLYGRLVLAETDPAGLLRSAAGAELTVPVGAVGIAKTMLRPSGKADFRGRLEDVVSQGEFLDAGEPLRVVAVEGARVVVERG